MHACVCCNQCHKKGRLVCRSTCHGCPALHRRTGPLAPHDNHSLAKGHHFCPNLTSNHRGVLVLCVRGKLAGVVSCWWWCGRCVISLVRCAPQLPFVVWQRGTSYNIRVWAAGMFMWRLPYFVSLFCFSYWCCGAHKSPAPTACTLLSVLEHATYSFPALAALVFVVSRSRCVKASRGRDPPNAKRHTEKQGNHERP